MLICRNVEGDRGLTREARWAQFLAEKSQQCRKYFLQWSTFASERPQVLIWGRQTSF